MHRTVSRNLLPFSRRFLQNSTDQWECCIRKYISKNTLRSVNPLMDVQAYTKEKLFKEEDNIFTPSAEEIERGEKLFVPRKKFHEIKFVKGAYYQEQAPDYDLPEVAFIGHSNVGKSTLIQSLLSHVTDVQVRTSKTPSHTKLLLFYQCGSSFALVDMPGYGTNQPENFVTSAEGFVNKRKNLHLTFLLVDSNVGLQPIHHVAIEMFEEFAKPYAAVKETASFLLHKMLMTKADKASKRQLVTSVHSVVTTIREKTTCCLPQPVLVSATTGLGLPFLKSFIAYITGCLDVKGNIR